MERAASASTKIPLTQLQCNTTPVGSNKTANNSSSNSGNNTPSARFNNFPTLSQLTKNMSTKVQSNSNCALVGREKLLIEAKLKNLSDELSKIDFTVCSSKPADIIPTTKPVASSAELEAKTTQDMAISAQRKPSPVQSTPPQPTNRTIVSQFHHRNLPIKAQSIDISEVSGMLYSPSSSNMPTPDVDVSFIDTPPQCDGSSSSLASNPNCDTAAPGLTTASAEDGEPSIKGMISKIKSLDSMRPIYPNVPFSPYGSPFSSPRTGRRRPPLRESRRISIEQSGSFLQLNQYKLLDQIGQGSYGLVKLAYSEEDSTHYAMKILSKRKLLRKAGLRGPKKGISPLDRVYREIAVLKKLDHPNVVKLVEVLDDPIDDSLYLVFELVQQGEVLTIPTDRPLTEERSWCVFRDVLQGLEYLHYQRIIHGDIKPGNLLLGECGQVKIADLGVCNEFLGEDAAVNNGSIGGTPAFRAPETLKVGEQYSYSGKASDIWALGATLYALIYGNVPFQSSTIPAVYDKIKNDKVHFPSKPSYSPELKELILKMLEKDPQKRITLPEIKEDKWVTAAGTFLLPTEEDNCRLVQISDDDINSVVKSIPKLDTLILIKTMLKKHSFQNPFSKGISGRAPQRGGSRLERFSRAGRSNSAPAGAYSYENMRQFSTENCLPSLIEGVSSSTTLPDETTVCGPPGEMELEGETNI